MRGGLRLIKKFYHLLLALYPAEFRAEFGAEMEDVFTIALAHVQQSDDERFWQLVWREIRDWPGTVLQAHLRVRRRKMASNGFVEEKPLQRRELLAALLIFLLPLLGPLGSVGNRPELFEKLAIMLFGGALLFGLGLAVIKRLPRWSLPYLGIVLVPTVLINAYPSVWGWLYPRFLDTYGFPYVSMGWSLSTRILYSGISDYLALFLVLVSALILVNVLRLLPYTRGVWQGIRADWTALSFLLYGGLVVLVVMEFDEYRHDDAWKFFAWISLALGAWLYLRAKGQKQRVLALLGGATGALWIVAVGKWVLIPLQQHWPMVPSELNRWQGPSTTLLSWVGIIILLLAPAVLSLLPPASGLTVSESEEPVTS